MKYVAALLLAWFATSAAAQVPFGREDVVETRFGSLQVVGGEVDNFISFGGLSYNQLYGTRNQILAVAGLADAEVDWALIEAPRNHGQCERIHRLLAITPRGMSFSSPFGPCNGQPVDMQIAPGQVQVTLTGDGGVSGTYTFNGQELHDGPFATAPAPFDVVPMRFAESRNVSTRFGRLWVEGGNRSERLVRDGTDLNLDAAEFYWFRAVYEGGEDSDYVIASSNHSGNMCGGYEQWFLIRVSAGDTQIAPPLSACANIFNIRVSDGALLFDQNHPDLTISHEAFRWDGVSMTSELVPAPLAAPAGAGDDVTRWIGRYSTEVFGDSSERARLGQIMTPDQVQQLAVAMSFGSQVVERNGWVLAQSCQQHNCGFNRGVWAVRIADGAVAAAILAGDPLQVREFGLTSDPVVAAAIAEQGR